MASFFADADDETLREILATVEEVEEYFAPYAPFRGLAGTYALAGWHKAMGAGPPARVAA